jgi:phosphatidylserine/phosphatidylglycerophosphate/cardiolipin synthase-like enzyme/uncharacterized membrane protein YdjX (TVP38/TMEM64 family)
VLNPGTNCWRIARAPRLAFLIDADAYFAAFREAISLARETVIIVGWDLDSRTPLGPAGSPTLLAFLNAALDRQPALKVFALAWDFSVIYTLERQSLPAYRFSSNGHPRLSFQLDAAHPVGASQHQKIVVVDDALAFAGGLDLTIRRWDTPAHRAAAPERVDPAGHPYPPVHDVQLVVDGEAAAALGELARARWQAAVGRPIPAVARPSDPWPAAVTPDARDVPVGIARTRPAFDGAPAVREVEQLHLDAIAAAERFIYIENQFLTSAAIGAALARRLDAPTGPEVVVVLPLREDGWLERSSLGILRSRLVARLEASDRRGRLRLYHPMVPDLDGACVNVHAKVVVVDDSLARVGSANLANRSMGLDSECDLVLDAALEPRLRHPIAAFRNRLLGEHLGADPAAIAEALAARGSLIATIEALAGGPRTLVPLPRPAAPGPGELRALSPTGLDLTFLDGLVCDPERPAPDLLLETLVPETLRRPVRRSLTGFALLVALVAAVAAAWRFTPLRQLLDPERLAALGLALRSHPFAPAAAIAAYLVGGLVFFPITLMLAATAFVFPPAAAIPISLAGVLASAAETYGLGRLVGRFRGDWLRGPRTARLEAQLRRRGILAVVAARLLPVGNFSIINMTAGALGIPFGAYMLGNALGVLPGVLGLTLFADRLGRAVRHPHPANLLVLTGVVAGILAAIAWLKRRIGRRR